MRLTALLLALLAIAACSPRAALVPVSGIDADIPTRSVFISTTRAPSGTFFGNERAGEVRYLTYDITIPQSRALGTIAWPRSGFDPATDFAVAHQTNHNGAPEFRRALARELQSTPDREAIIYVHGFNNTFDEGVLRIAQLATDFHVDGVAVHYSWPSAGNPLGYAYDRDSILIARDGLDQLITDVHAAGAQNLIIVAHSVGAMLVMETLRQRSIAEAGSVTKDVDGVILISPDIDVDLFRSQVARIGDLPKPFGIFVSHRDRVLALSARLTGQRNRFGNVGREDNVAALGVSVLDVTKFSHGSGHFTVGSSPTLIRLFNRANSVEAAFKGDRAGRAGLIPGTILTVQNTAGAILAPAAAISGSLQETP